MDSGSSTIGPLQEPGTPFDHRLDPQAPLRSRHRQPGSAGLHDEGRRGLARAHLRAVRPRGEASGARAPLPGISAQADHHHPRLQPPGVGDPRRRRPWRRAARRRASTRPARPRRSRTSSTTASRRGPRREQGRSVRKKIDAKRDELPLHLKHIVLMKGADPKVGPAIVLGRVLGEGRRYARARADDQRVDKLEPKPASRRSSTPRAPPVRPRA
jgi:hypothetical protein